MRNEEKPEGRYEGGKIRIGAGKSEDGDQEGGKRGIKEEEVLYSNFRERRSDEIQIIY